MSSPTMMPMSLDGDRPGGSGTAGCRRPCRPANTPVATSAFTDSRQIVPKAPFSWRLPASASTVTITCRTSARRGPWPRLVDHEIAGAAGAADRRGGHRARPWVSCSPSTISSAGARWESPFTVVGITGSVGKTTTKDLLKALLSQNGIDAVAPVGSFNNEIGLPLTSLKVNAGTRFLVAEMGANHVG